MIVMINKMDLNTFTIECDPQSFLCRFTSDGNVYEFPRRPLPSSAHRVLTITNRLFVIHS